MPGYHLPYFTAAVKDLYARHGLEVEIVYPEPGPNNIRAVAQGRYDVCLTSVAHFMRALTEDGGVEARFVFMVARHSHMGVLFRSGRGATRGGRVTDFTDLAVTSFLGHRESPFTREYLHLLRLLGRPEPTIVELPYGAIKDALGAGEGDVTADYVDLLPDYRTAATPAGVTVDALPFHRAGIDVYGSGLVAGTGFIEEHGDALAAVAATITEALEETRRDPAPGVSALSERFPDAGAARTLESWHASEEIIFSDDGAPLGTMDALKWERTIDYHSGAHGTARTDPDWVYADLG